MNKEYVFHCNGCKNQTKTILLSFRIMKQVKKCMNVHLLVCIGGQGVMSMLYTQGYIVMSVMSLMIVTETHIAKTVTLKTQNMVNTYIQKKRGINMGKMKEYYLEQQMYCEHKNTEYIPREDDVNVQEALM